MLARGNFPRIRSTTMPRRNLYLFSAVSLISLACYQKADSAHRSHVGKMFDTFATVVKEIEAHYLEPVDERELFEGALSGMVSQLDPYSAYIGPEAYASFRENLDQQFGGVGIEVFWDPAAEVLIVMSPMPGTPAYDAGILAGDRITAINGTPTDELAGVEDAVARLKGPPGESVRVKIVRDGEAEPREMALIRAIIKVSTVLGDTRSADGRWNFLLPGPEAIGYVRITGFGDQTEAELDEALAALAAQRARAIILDVRNNAGGLLEAAVGTCRRFVREGTIVSIRGRDGRDPETFSATGRVTFPDIPLVVIANKYSASASEIVAACLQDNHRAVVIGERTWGKGTVQNVIPLENGTSSLKLTTASYWRPSGVNIHRGRKETERDAWGVLPTPGFEAPLSDDELRQVLEARRMRDQIPGVTRPGTNSGLAVDVLKVDIPLFKAVEHLRTVLSARPASA